jgi:maltose-binding protein MalE
VWVEDVTMKNLFAVAAVCFVAACGKPNAEIIVETNENGSFGVDFVGQGGSIEESFVWSNPSGAASVAEYSMDITAASGGSVTVTVLDAEDEEVGAFQLTAGQGDDSLDGLTARGAGGDWVIVVELTDFEGDGTLTLDGGNADDI